jgi:hypothetical protein
MPAFWQERVMPSNTTITKARRRIRKRGLGRENKAERAKAATPKFPIHQEK